jgi:2-methylcitrate dehydratase PrpD
MAAPAPILKQMIADAASFDARRLTPEIRAKARLCLLDFLSCAIEAAPLPWSRQAAAVAAPGDAATILAGGRSTAEDAAFANAVAGHGLVREDMHPPSIAHLGVVVWPTLLALAESRRVDGPALIRAAVLGYEIGGRLGRVVITPEVARLFRPTGIVGPLAAAFAGASLLGLDAETACSAVALAANCSAGLNEWPRHGADEMYFHPGFAARNAIRSLALAQAGAWASPSIVEGAAGTVAAYARRPAPERIALFPNGDAEILAVFNKPVPACNFAQSPCQAAISALAASGATSTEIAAIRVDTYAAALNYPGCAHAGPFATPLQAKMSIVFGVAAALARGEIAEANYARLDDEEIQRMVGITELRLDPALDAAFPAKQGTRVTLRLKDGRVATHAMDDVAFADAALVEARFRAAAASLGRDRAEAILADVAALDALPDAGRIARACAATPSMEASRA